MRRNLRITTKIALIWMVLVALPHLSFAKKPSPSPEATIKVFSEKDKFFFQVCDPKCEPFGNPSGYSREQIEHWKKFRPSDWKDILPYFGAVGGLALFLTFLAMAPTGGLLALAAGVVALISYGHSRNPQTQTGMNNEVYGEFSARPEMIEELKKFLADVDKGESPMLFSPRVITSRHHPQRPKNLLPPLENFQKPSESKPAD